MMKKMASQKSPRSTHLLFRLSACIFIPAFVLIFFFGLDSQYLSGQPVAEEIAARADAYFQLQTKFGRFSGAVLIALNGKPVLSRGYGLANYELQVPVTARTKFRLGSLTKAFTAAAVLQLREKGLLQLEDTLARFFPDYPSGDKITIHHLLTHTSGIPCFTRLKEYHRFKLNPTTPLKTIEFFKPWPLLFEPGSNFAYSNSGYILLTAIIEKISGRSYATYLRENIFLPLNLLDTTYDDPNLIIKHRALGYSQRDGEIINAPYIDMTVPAGAGGLLSTVEDMFAWDQALRGDKILNAESRQKMFTPFFQNYGYGWEIKNINGRILARHSGGIEGFASHITRFLDENTCFLILSNFDFAPLEQMAEDLMALILGQSFAWPKERVETELTFFPEANGWVPELILMQRKR